MTIFMPAVIIIRIADEQQAQQCIATGAKDLGETFLPQAFIQASSLTLIYRTPEEEARARIGGLAIRERIDRWERTDKSGLQQSVEIIRRGWRKFRCDECGHVWEWATRDRLSPSGENCPECGDQCFPYENREDASIPADNMGNIMIPWNQSPPQNDDFPIDCFSLECLKDAQESIATPE